MQAEFDITIPEREEDITDKQLHFIKRLYKSLNSEGLPVEPETLGKWQASEFIDQLIEIKDHREESGAFAGWEEEDSGSPLPVKPGEPFFQTIVGQVAKVLLILVGIGVAWIVILS